MGFLRDGSVSEHRDNCGYALISETRELDRGHAAQPESP